MSLPEFTPFPKIARLSRQVVITEKIDGTNASILITDDGQVHAASRSRWITPGKQTDNYGFAAWVEANKDQLITELGPGHHFGEWWGRGIQRGYNAADKFFSLFNVSVWAGKPLQLCRVVPVLYEGMFDTIWIDETINGLRYNGSKAMPGYDKPEGIVIYHTASQTLFKKTLEKDEVPKGLCESPQTT